MLITRVRVSRYQFTSCSTMKPTQVKCAVGSLNQLPPWVEISGDVRLTPFYEVADVRAKLNGFIDDMNANITALRTSTSAQLGPGSHSRMNRSKLNIAANVGAMLVNCAFTSCASGKPTLRHTVTDCQPK